MQPNDCFPDFFALAAQNGLDDHPNQAHRIFAVCYTH